MTEILITGGVGIVASIVSGWTSWIFARKKYNTEVDHNYIENLSKALETYDSIIAHNKSEIEYLMRENTELRKEVADLRKQMLNLTMNICMDLTCTNRVREQAKKNLVRFSETKKVKDNEESKTR